MDYRTGILKVCLLASASLLLSLSALAQDAGPGYYYSNFQPKTLKGVTLELCPMSMPRQGLLESFKPSFLDVNVGGNFNYVPGTYKVNWAPELYLFAGYASYTPKEDSLIYPIYNEAQSLTDYGKIAFSNLSVIRAGGQIIFWNHTPKKYQIGPGMAVSVGQYSYSFYAMSGSGAVGGKLNQTFVMFSPCLATKYWINSQLGIYLNLGYNFFADGGKRNLSLKTINPNLGKTYSSFTPRIGVTYNFKKR